MRAPDAVKGNVAGELVIAVAFGFSLALSILMRFQLQAEPVGLRFVGLAEEALRCLQV